MRMCFLLLDWVHHCWLVCDCAFRVRHYCWEGNGRRTNYCGWVCALLLRADGSDDVDCVRDPFRSCCWVCCANEPLDHHSWCSLLLLLPHHIGSCRCCLRKRRDRTKRWMIFHPPRQRKETVEEAFCYVGCSTFFLCEFCLFCSQDA